VRRQLSYTLSCNCASFVLTKSYSYTAFTNQYVNNVLKHRTVCLHVNTPGPCHCSEELDASFSLLGPRISRRAVSEGFVLGRMALREGSSCDSSVGIALGYGLDDRGSRVRFPAGGWEFFFSPPRPERLWGPPSILSNGYQGLFPWG
jgi:hypothetical protein